MNRGTVIFVGVIAVLLLGIALIDAGVQRPVDWTKTFNIRHKIPFGLFVLHEELPNILSGEREIGGFNEYYDHISALDSATQHDVALMGIGTSARLYAEEDVNKALDFVYQGGEIFLSVDYLSYLLFDTLNIHTNSLHYDKFYPTDERVSYSLVGSEEEIFLDKNDNYWIFSKLDRNTCTILGYLHADGHTLPNFISVSHGKGTFYLHLLPLVFTNYNLLEADSYAYASTALNVLQHKKIYLQDAYAHWDESRTPLRVILGMKGFSQAWHLLLLGLVLLMVFKGRREQRAVEVVLPEPNLSKDFAKAIGALYYESGQPGNIIKKKIDYFLYDLRGLYQVETLDLTNGKMIRLLALKSGVDEQEVKELMGVLHRYNQKESFTFEDVKMINNKIEEFKRKANIV